MSTCSFKEIATLFCVNMVPIYNAIRTRGLRQNLCIVYFCQQFSNLKILNKAPYHILHKTINGFFIVKCINDERRSTHKAPRKVYNLLFCGCSTVVNVFVTYRNNKQKRFHCTVASRVKKTAISD